MSEETPLDPMRVLCQLIDKRGGVLLTTMKRVRIAYGSDRLGKNIRESIHQKLAQLGIGHYPRDLPQYQWDRVRLYRLGTPVGDLLEAAYTLTKDGNELLRRSAADEATRTLKKVRELVCS